VIYTLRAELSSISFSEPGQQHEHLSHIRSPDTMPPLLEYTETRRREIVPPQIAQQPHHPHNHEQQLAMVDQTTTPVSQHQIPNSNISSSAACMTPPSEKSLPISKRTMPHHSTIAQQQKQRGTPKKRDSAILLKFVYATLLSMILIGYTEFHLSMFLSVEDNHHNLMPIIGNRTQPTRLRALPNKVLPKNESILAAGEIKRSHNLGHQMDNDSSEDSEDDEELDPIVHIIHSRFMQNQPDLIHLGEARLELFQHFFIKSLEAQSSSNFVCIIRTDPELHPKLKEQIIGILQRSKLVYILVATNEIPKSQYEDILVGNIKPSDVWSGSLEEIKRYLRIDSTPSSIALPSSSISPPRIIETRLDADDGLNRLFVETMQAEADEGYGFYPQTWRLWCVANHAEWQFQSLWQTSENEMEDVGTIVALQVNYCVTPGLSIAFLGDEQSMQAMPSTMKHERLLHTRLCKNKSSNKTDVDCRSFVPMIMAAFRARTPTSAGMLNLVYNGTSFNQKYIAGASKQKDIQSQLWWAVKRLFGFSKHSARNINQYMKDRIKAIAQDNLKGQCTRGHSCKNSSQILLRSILEGNT